MIKEIKKATIEGKNVCIVGPKGPWRSEIVREIKKSFKSARVLL